MNVELQKQASSKSGMREKSVPLFLFGATGMLAGELMRLLELHPVLELVAGSSRDPAPLQSSQPHLVTPARAANRASTVEVIRAAVAAEGKAAVVLALPHGESARTYAELQDALGPVWRRVLVVDLAADFRLADKDLYRSAYGVEHPLPSALGEFVYGLPEFHRARIKGATRVAAPGCFATALQLAALPAADAGLLDRSRPWIFHAVTGSSGSGSEPKPGTHHPHRHGNLWAYSLDGHRHEAELTQALEMQRPREPLPPIHFVPHSGPFARGIHLTAALPLAKDKATLTTQEARAIYAACFADELFVEVAAEGVPDLRRVVGSNRASVGVHVKNGILTVLVTLDNLVKGGAGQALQCLNVMLGLPETAGLPRSGLGVA